MARRCKGTTQKGTRCTFNAADGSEHCRRHGGLVKTGRRRMLTKELITEISSHIRKGVPAKYAAQAVGISESTYHDWRSQGEEWADSEVVPKGEELFLEFLESITTARAEFLTSMALVVTQSAVGYRGQDNKQHDPDARSAMWLLERRGGGDWTPNIDVKHSGSIRREPVEVPETDERLSAVGGILAEIGVVDGGTTGDGSD